MGEGEEGAEDEPPTEVTERRVGGLPGQAEGVDFMMSQTLFLYLQVLAANLKSLENKVRNK